MEFFRGKRKQFLLILGKLRRTKVAKKANFFFIAMNPFEHLNKKLRSTPSPKSIPFTHKTWHIISRYSSHAKLISVQLRVSYEQSH